MPTRACSLADLTSRRPADRVDHRQPGADRPLGIVLMRLRVAEIDQHAVAHVLGDKAVEAGDDLGDGAVIGADQLAQILRVEPGRQRGRADQIAEHHRQLPALGIGRCRVHRGVPPSPWWQVPRRRARRWRRAACGDGRPRSRRDPDQVVGRQLRQHFGIDHRCRGTPAHIASRPKPLQPRRYVHAVILGSEERHPSWTRIDLCPLSYQRQR